ncbi:FAD-dependent oxidoreductase [Solihabitans fulvus]|uniref:FAD-dependent oxidoreductase n=1 Tax=Solihabitans fulvus TaxID=1892852 RepID=A0A5B2XNT8_9PSEU|nr:FAD-dependent monooxygenase [Solihabitans fulvus]KAA2264805.1 FAD-dependent oxidoreductase [Solihabitans fulvus]
MKNTNVLISGAGIAGPALAYWLERRGFTATVVERAAGLREGGSAVDFRGEQMRLLERMEVLADIRAKETAMGAEVVVDENGRELVSLPSSFFAGEVEIARGDLTRILYERTKDSAEYVFGDWITSLTETPDGVDVTFAHGEPRRFDLVVGADGLHSAVRRLAFGEEEQFRTDLGFYIAGFSTDNTLGLDHTGRIYNEPGRGVMVSSSRDHAKADVMFVFEAANLPYARRDAGQQKRIVAEAFAGVGWETPGLVRAMWEAEDMYFDSLSQIHLDRWSTGRVVLLGDAAWASGPGGSATGLAMLGAYVLASELAAADGDHATAFAAYEAHLRPGAALGQKQAKGAGPFLAPVTEKKIKQRNRVYRMLSTKILAGLFNKITAGAANKVKVKDYPTLPTVSRAA